MNMSNLLILSNSLVYLCTALINIYIISIMLNFWEAFDAYRFVVICIVHIRKH